MSRPKKLRCLIRRMDFLAALIAKDPDREWYFERRELAALRWAIPVLEATLEQRSPARVDHAGVRDTSAMMRRSNFLITFLQAAPGEEWPWEREELAALRWGIPILDRVLAEERRHREALVRGLDEEVEERQG